ncbi:hypothetical protein Golax_016985 [Gossypium laxum]|uniref:RNase H type-1 domain-containing protein n=1 Tax=Gossypium laxum TaxID=34288 RepID=A0A7J8YYW4_9ROSI|nr:hypothetical protein [Gossypium laxum]
MHQRISYMSSETAHWLEKFGNRGGSYKGVLRDKNEEWILGYNKYLGNCSILDAELWGILDGLILIQQRGDANVVIQFDSLEAIKAIHGNALKTSNQKDTPHPIPRKQLAHTLHS